MKIKIKKIALLPCFSLIVFWTILPIQIFASQQKISSNTKNNITINPGILFSGKLIDIKYERKFNEIFTLSINPTYYSLNSGSTEYSTNGNSYNLSLNTMNFWLQGRIYLSKSVDALQGFFIAPEISFGFANIEGTSSSTSSNKIYSSSFTFNSGIATGYQWILKEHFSIDVYFGVTKYYMANPETKDLFLKGYYSSSDVLILPSWGLGIGYAF